MSVAIPFPGRVWRCQFVFCFGSFSVGVLMVRGIWNISVGLLLVLWSGVTFAGEELPAVKPLGIGLEILTQAQDFKLTELKLDHPALMPLSNAKDQIKTESDIKSTSVKLDYWVKPYLNVFGSVSQLEGESRVKLSEVPGISVPDMVVSADGQLYNLGATLVARGGNYLGSLSYTHTATDLEAASEKGSHETLVATVGRVTDFGVFTVGAIQQNIKGDFNGTLDLPLLGSVKAKISAENAEQYSYLLGYYKKLDKDFYISTHLELGEREGIRLGVSRRF